MPGTRSDKSLSRSQKIRNILPTRWLREFHSKRLTHTVRKVFKDFITNIKLHQMFEYWREVTVELEPEVLTSEFQVRFWFVSDRAATDEGWTIDDVEVRL